MGEDHDQAKELLRREVREARAHLSRQLVRTLSHAACLRLADLPAFGMTRHVVVYAPIENEVDPGSIVDAATADGKRVYYPRVNGKSLDFLTASPGTLAPGAFGIPEPQTGAPLPLAVDEAVLFVVPGLAFDLRGIRLGRGGGYYDRTLARYARARRLGLAYEFQVLPALPATRDDVAMDAVVTEARVLECRGAIRQ
jgi:5-formyltetrahydrofolate cyclo-ligase